MIIIDTHVHLYPMHSPSHFFDFAYANFELNVKKYSKSSECQYILFFTESTSQNWFSKTSALLKSGEMIRLGRWSIKATPEKNCIMAISDSLERLHLIQGYQIVTAEKLEVLALGLGGRISDGLPLRQTINLVIEAGAIPVLPWGVGKWFGIRGALINDLLKSEVASQIALGDNGGRPGVFPYPKQFKCAEKLGIPVFPGSDPLPLTGEEKKVGQCGLVYLKELDDTPVSQQVIQLLKNRKIEFEKEFVLESNFRFLINQTRLRLKI